MKPIRTTIIGGIGALLMLGIITPAEEVAAETRDEVSETVIEVSPVINPEIPASITFAGKKVDLDPTDMWERLDR